MSTEAQINANRLNAQKSTGPKTAEGKATVSKNAVKHGFFALDTVISGENKEEYELFRDALLEELAPDGAMQTMLAERAVSLSWRLKRIEHIQNQVIEAMLERDFDNPLSKQIQKLVPEHRRQKKSEHLALGYITLKDYANSRAMERLLMYERRLENSLFRTTNELRKLKIIKQIEEAETVVEEPAKTSTPLTKQKLENLSPREQSQFALNLMGTKSYYQGNYEKNSGVETPENKADLTLPKHKKSSKKEENQYEIAVG